MFTTNETNRILNDISFDRVDQPDVNPAELNSRPLSGKEARSARSAQIMASAGERRKSMAQGGISGEEFQV